MAENDEFIREVNEDYRRERAAKIWAKYGTLMLVLAVALVGAVGGWRYWQHSQRIQAEATSAQYDEASKLAQAGKLDEADKLLAKVGAEGPAGYRLLARFRVAADAARRDANTGAVEYDKLAADSSIGDALRDLARLRAALLRLDGTDPAPALADLQGLASPTGAFRHTAREMLGLTAMKRGEFDEAERWFGQIAADADTPQGLRQRIEVYEALVSGGKVTLSEAKPAEPAAPPPPITR